MNFVYGTLSQLPQSFFFLITGLLFKDWSYSISLILLVQPPQSFSKIIIFLYYQIQLLLLLLQHFPESSFTALFFLISWIGATSKNFQQNDSFLLLNFSSKDWSYSISPIFMDWPNEMGLCVPAMWIKARRPSITQQHLMLWNSAVCGYMADK